jgi:hypothetical protein
MQKDMNALFGSYLLSVDRNCGFQQLEWQVSLPGEARSVVTLMMSRIRVRI